MESSAYVIMLVGPIASGKSTYVKNVIAAGFPGSVVSNDGIVNALHNNVYTAYNKMLGPVYHAVHMTILRETLKAGLPVIIDGTNGQRSGRASYRKIIEQWQAPLNMVIFERATPEMHATRRFIHDPRGLSYEKWLEVAQQHERVYVPPAQSEANDFQWVDKRQIIHSDKPDWYTWGED